MTSFWKGGRVRFNAAVLKTVGRVTAIPGFESQSFLDEFSVLSKHYSHRVLCDFNGFPSLSQVDEE